MQPMPVRYVEKMRSIKLKLGIERVIVVKLTSQNLSHTLLGTWGLGTAGIKVSRPTSTKWGKRSEWCQTCGEDGPLGGDYTNVDQADVNRLVNPEDPESSLRGVMSTNPGYYQNTPGQGMCKLCRGFCPLGQATTQDCSATQPRVCEDKVAPQLCTSTSGLTMAPWRGPLVDGPCVERSTSDVLEFEAMLDPFEINEAEVYTTVPSTTVVGTDPTTGFDPKDESEGDEDLTATANLVRSSSYPTSSFIDKGFPYAANMYIVKERMAVKYSLTDNVGNAAAEATREVTVKDTVPPTLVLCSKGSDAAVCMNAMPSDKPCPLQHGTDAANVWGGWKGGITAEPGLDTALEFDVSKGVVVGAQMQQSALAAFNRIRDDPTVDPWVVACDVRDRGHPFLDDVSAGTVQGDTSIREASKRIADWTDVKTFFVGGNQNVRPRTTTGARIKYRLADASGNIAFIERKVTLTDKTPPEIFPIDDADGQSAYATQSSQFNAPRKVEATLKGVAAAYTDRGAVVEDVVGGVLDSKAVLSISSGPQEVSSWNDAGSSSSTADGWEVGKRWASEDGGSVQLLGIDITRRGRYKIVYTAADASGNVATTDRWVIVEDTTPPTMSLVWPPSSANVHGHAGAAAAAGGDGGGGGGVVSASAGVYNFGMPFEDPGWEARPIILMTHPLRFLLSRGH